MTLTETLTVLGYSHRKSDIFQYQHDVLAADGVVVFTGTATDTWAWLRAYGLID